MGCTSLPKAAKSLWARKTFSTSLLSEIQGIQSKHRFLPWLPYPPVHILHDLLKFGNIT